MDFVYQKKEALSKKNCSRIIQLMDQYPHLLSPGAVGGGFLPEIKYCTDFGIYPDTLYYFPELEEPLRPVLSALSEGLEDFKKNPFIAQSLDCLDSWRIDHCLNIQRYFPNQCYFGIHCENATIKTSNRVMAWMIYLNTITEGGGTEFVNQKTIVPAEEGKLLIWPAYWTHTHRGVVSKTQTKYIITGWYVYDKS